MRAQTKTYRSSKLTDEKRLKERLWAREYRINHPERIRKNYLKRMAKKLGVDPVELIEYDKQHSKLCDICNQPESVVKTLHVDHDHESNHIRGLLCSHCNTGIGLLRDDKTLLLKALDYLSKTPVILKKKDPLKIEHGSSKQSELMKEYLQQQASNSVPF